MMTSLLSILPCDSTLLNKAVRPAVTYLPSSLAIGLGGGLQWEQRSDAPLESEWEAQRCQVVEQ